MPQVTWLLIQYFLSHILSSLLINFLFHWRGYGAPCTPFPFKYKSGLYPLNVFIFIFLFRIVNHPLVARFLKLFLIAPRSKVPNITSGRTLVKSTIWSHPVESTESEFSVVGWPNWVKNPGEKLYAALGAKFQSARVALCRVQGATPALWNFAPVVRKVSL